MHSNFFPKTEVLHEHGIHFIGSSPPNIIIICVPARHKCNTSATQPRLPYDPLVPLDSHACIHRGISTLTKRVLCEARTPSPCLAGLSKASGPFLDITLRTRRVRLLCPPPSQAMYRMPKRTACLTYWARAFQGSAVTLRGTIMGAQMWQVWRNGGLEGHGFRTSLMLNIVDEKLDYLTIRHGGSSGRCGMLVA